MVTDLKLTVYTVVVYGIYAIYPMFIGSKRSAGYWLGIYSKSQRVVCGHTDFAAVFPHLYPP